ncbi:hypothetical protein M405DRAFT_832762 [Rhizopogon salebrosus TDB-379]|nr:hypothetical protein M405DRAFT_832762 [Rhizopogon salebrosus TDB-379]
MNLLHHLNQFTVSHAQCAPHSFNVPNRLCLLHACDIQPTRARQRRAPQYCSKISTLQVDIPQIKIGQRYDVILVAI